MLNSILVSPPPTSAWQCIRKEKDNSIGSWITIIIELQLLRQHRCLLIWRRDIWIDLLPVIRLFIWPGDSALTTIADAAANHEGHESWYVCIFSVFMVAPSRQQLVHTPVMLTLGRGEDNALQCRFCPGSLSISLSLSLISKWILVNLSPEELFRIDTVAGNYAPSVIFWKVTAMRKTVRSLLMWHWHIFVIITSFWLITSLWYWLLIDIEDVIQNEEQGS